MRKDIMAEPVSERMPTHPKEERRQPVQKGNTGFGQTMGKASGAHTPASKVAAGYSPNMPADERRAPVGHSNGMAGRIDQMAGGPLNERSRPHVPALPGKREPGDRP